MGKADRARALLTDHDIKQKNLAKFLNISEAKMSNYLNGKSDMPTRVVTGIAQYFHVTTDYLLGLTDYPELPVRLSAGERELVERLRTLSRDQKELIAQNIRLMQEQNQRRGLKDGGYGFSRQCAHWLRMTNLRA